MIPSYILAIENDDDRYFMERLYECYSRLMYSEIYKIVEDRWWAEDLMHATIERLIDKVDELRTKDRNHLVNYIISASRNQAKNYIRDNKARSGYSFDEHFDMPDWENSRDEVEFKLILAEDLRRLPLIWDKLDDESRYVLEGYYILEKSMPRLAAELNIKPGSVRMALSRARKRAYCLMQGEN